MKIAIITFLVIVIIGGVALFLLLPRNTQPQVVGGQDNISIVDGKQIIEISAKGGYSPRTTTAKASIPTVIKVKTSSTFDCSSALTIPSLNYRNNLPPTGETSIEVSSQKPGTVMRGLCSMGMYNFTINFN